MKPTCRVYGRVGRGNHLFLIYETFSAPSSVAAKNDPLHLLLPPFPPDQLTHTPSEPLLRESVTPSASPRHSQQAVSSSLPSFWRSPPWIRKTLAASAEPLESRLLISLDIFARLLFRPTAAYTACLPPQCLADIFNTPKWQSLSTVQMIKSCFYFWQASHFCSGHTEGVPRKWFCQFFKLFLTFLICLGHVSPLVSHLIFYKAAQILCSWLNKIGFIWKKIYIQNYTTAKTAPYSPAFPTSHAVVFFKKRS